MPKTRSSPRKGSKDKGDQGAVPKTPTPKKKRKSQESAPATEPVRRTPRQRARSDSQASRDASAPASAPAKSTRSPRRPRSESAGSVSSSGRRKRSASVNSSSSAAARKSHDDTATADPNSADGSAQSSRRKRSESAGSASSARRKRSASVTSTSSTSKKNSARKSRTKTPAVVDVSNNENEVSDTPKQGQGKASNKQQSQSASKSVKKRAPVMDVQVHRIRNLGFHPKAIAAMAHVSTIAGRSFLAVSRENGSVELCTLDKLRNVVTISGSADQVVTCLAWVHEQTSDEMESVPTLVGASGNGSIFVVDFVERCFRSVSSNGGGVFCLTALTKSNLVAAGCEDGIIRILKVEGGRLEHDSTVQSTGAPVLSIAWRRAESTNEVASGMSASVLFTGVADGTIRRYDATQSSKSGSFTWKSTLRMTVESFGRRIQTRVWALKCLSNGLVVSGDSLGHVQLWDGDSGTLHQSFKQNTEKADVLSLDVSSDQKKIFASGVDSRVVCVELSNADTNHWVLSRAYRPHTHDVKSVVVCSQQKTLDKDGEKVEITRDLLVTGGVDTKLCYYHVDGFSNRRPQTVYPWPAVTPIALAKSSRTLLMRREDRVDLYKLRPKQESNGQTPVLVEEDTLLGTVQVKSKSNLVDAVVSEDMQLLALCDATGLLLFRLAFDEDGQLRPTRLQLNATVTPCSLLTFINDTSLAVASSKGKVHIISFAASADAEASEASVEGPVATLAQTMEQHDPYDGWTSSIRVSSDARWLSITRNNMKQSSSIIVYYREEADDQFEHYWDLPRIDSEVTSTTLTSLDRQESRLVVACSNFECYVFDLQKRKLDSWSEEAGYPVSQKMSPELTYRHDYPVRIAVNPASPSKLLMGSFGAFVAIDTSKRFPLLCRSFPEAHVRGRKRRKHTTLSTEVEEKGETATCCLRYNSMIFLDFVDRDEMVVVEQPWLDVVATFPEALHRTVFGS